MLNKKGRGNLPLMKYILIPPFWKEQIDYKPELWTFKKVALKKGKREKNSWTIQNCLKQEINIFKK